MCGIAGIRFRGGVDREGVTVALRKMVSALAHRGPDDSGVWADPNTGLVLGHRRLSILDLSSLGHQPMVSASGRFVLIFNGEIYNHLSLRRELDVLSAAATSPSNAQFRSWYDHDALQTAWRGHSDTEVLLGGFDRWGIKDTLERAVGMFALAVWDRSTRELYLARDRAGEKPLYYGWSQGRFVFASELKALRAMPGFDNPIDRKALGLYMRYSAVPAPHSIYKDIVKLPPGCWIVLTEHDLAQTKLPQPKPFWSWLNVAQEGAARPKEHLSPESAVEALDLVLKDSVADQMVADVPVGAFLSGGVDSSTVVALMQAQSMRPIKTFSIGFSERAYDEARHAKRVAVHLGTDHSELYVTPEDSLRVIPKLPDIYCEPFADCSQIPTFLVAQLARKQVAVSLSGDGGDELFGGYNRHYMVAQLWSKAARIPKPWRSLIARAVRAVSPAVWDGTYAAFESVLPRKYGMRMPGEKLHKAADSLEATSLVDLYQRLRSHWQPAGVVIGGLEHEDDVAQAPGFPRPAEQMMALDGSTYLPDDILVKLDRAAMAVSLETRMPFLDHRVVEFAWQLPFSMKVNNGQGKWILRQVLNKYVPKGLVDRPKMGFAVPIDSWLRGPLRDWAESLLEDSRLKREGYLHPSPVREKWREHMSGRRNWQYHLWDVLMFQAWLERQQCGAG
jgi:asparagine synthase (glutamine-hydrolysing)